MTLQELQSLLKRNQVCDEAYSLGTFRDSAVSILHSGGSWQCVFEEHGTLIINREFRKESEACEFAADLLL